MIRFENFWKVLGRFSEKYKRTFSSSHKTSILAYKPRLPLAYVTALNADLNEETKIWTYSGRNKN